MRPPACVVCDVIIARAALAAIDALSLGLNGAPYPQTDEPTCFLLCPGPGAVFYVLRLLLYIPASHLQVHSLAWHIGSCVT